MTTKQIITKFLEEVPAGRERRNRPRAIWRVLEKKYGEMEAISFDKFLMYYPEMESISRLIRQIQQEREDLRASDYQDKDELEQSAILSLGYSMGHVADVKKLNLIK